MNNTLFKYTSNNSLKQSSSQYSLFFSLCRYKVIRKVARSCLSSFWPPSLCSTVWTGGKGFPRARLRRCTRCHCWQWARRLICSSAYARAWGRAPCSTQWNCSRWCLWRWLNRCLLYPYCFCFCYFTICTLKKPKGFVFLAIIFQNSFVFATMNDPNWLEISRNKISYSVHIIRNCLIVRQEANLFFFCFLVFGEWTVNLRFTFKTTLSTQ